MNKYALTATVVGLSTFTTFAVAGVDMDHTSPVGANLIGTPTFGVNQIFTDGTFDAFNGAVIDDFTATGSNVVRVKLAFEMTTAGQSAAISGYHLAIWSSAASAAGSGNGMIGSVLNADFGSGAATLSSLSGTGSGTPVCPFAKRRT